MCTCRMGFFLLLAMVLFIINRSVSAQSFCNDSSSFMLKTECASCMSTLTESHCPNGTEQVTRGQGLRDCQYFSHVSAQVSYPFQGCRHICKGVTVIPKCCPGYYGPDCHACPGGADKPCSNNGKCMEGMFGNGTCICDAKFVGFGCENCLDGNTYGTLCDQQCKCERGTCNSGSSGDGSCSCQQGYQGRYCETRSECVNSKADIFFIINLVQDPSNFDPIESDSSSGEAEPATTASPPHNNIEAIREFLAHFISEFSIGIERVQFGFYIGEKALAPGSLSSKASLLDFIKDYDFFLPSSSDITGHLNAVKDKFFEMQADEKRSDSYKVVVLLTNSIESWNIDAAVKINEAMISEGINIYSVASMETPVMKFVLKKMTFPNSSYSIDNLQAEVLIDTFESVLIDICNKSGIPQVPTCESITCYNNSRCIESEGGPTCICNQGYKEAGDKCDYIDRCQDSPSPCSVNGICISTGPGSYNCSCNSGYRGDGQVCVVVDPCEENNGECPPDTSDCVFVSPGHSSCECIDGYENFLSGVGCSLIDVCQRDNNLCHENANCTTTGPNDYICVCNDGYGGDGKYCYGNIIEKVREMNAYGNETLRGRLYYILRAMQNTYHDAFSNHGPFTVFVSVDSGFTAGQSRAQLETLMNTREYARRILRLHTLVGEFPIQSLQNTSTFYTLQGDAAELRCTDDCENPSSELSYKLEGHFYMASILASNIKASNGIIHVLSRLLFKPSHVTGSIQKTLWDILLGNDQFTKFRTLVQTAGMEDLFSNSTNITVFAPNDQALNSMPAGTYEYLLSEEGKGKLSTTLAGHIVHNESIDIASLINMNRILMYSNYFVDISVTITGRVQLNRHTNISQADILAENGLLYRVDSLIMSDQVDPILPHRCDHVSTTYVWGDCKLCLPSLRRCPLPTDSLTGTVSRCNKSPFLGEISSLIVSCRPKCQRNVTTPRCCPGFYGAACYPCPGGHQNPCFGRGECYDSLDGNGTCSCHDGFEGAACEFCSDKKKYGVICTTACPCLHGTCDSGVDGSGECLPGTCTPGFRGRNCDTQVQKCAKRLRCHAFAECIKPTLKQLLSDPKFLFLRFLPAKKRNKVLRRISKRGKCECLPGYRGSGEQCEEIDPCREADRGGCHQQATCHKISPGRSRCECIEGWVGDGTYCYPSTPCHSQIHCHVHARCLPSAVGKYICVCKEDYHGNGTSCVPNNVCLLSNGGCHKTATCTPAGPGLARCSCPPGLDGDGFICYGTIFREVKNHPRLTHLSRLLQVIPNGDDFLAGVNSSFTFFAPSDDSLLSFMKTAEFDFWKDEDNILVLLSYHTLSTSLSEESLRNYTDADLFTLVARGRVSINVTCVGETTFIDGAQVVVADLPATNGIVHIIDGVLEPYPVRAQQPTLGQLLSTKPEYSTFLRMLNETGLLEEVENLAEYTVFAPNDDLWGNLNLSKADNKRYLSYYIIPEEMPRWRLTERNESVSTLLGDHLQAHLNLTLKNDQVFVNSRPVVGYDMWTAGGVVHGMLGLLDPVLEWCDRNVVETTWTDCRACQQSSVRDGLCPRGFQTASPLTQDINCSYIPADSAIRRGDGCRTLCSKTTIRRACCPGYFGAECSECPGDDGVPCNGRGECDDGLGGMGTCSCWHGYAGHKCDHCTLGVCEQDRCGINPQGCDPPSKCQVLSGAEWEDTQGTEVCLCEPESAPFTGCSVGDVVSNMDGIGLFKNIFLKSNMSDILTMGPAYENISAERVVTLFVPLDTGFTLPTKVNESENRDRFLFDHMAGEEIILGPSIANHSIYTAMSSFSLSVSKFFRNATVNETYRINDVAVVSGNIVCTNGIIHLLAGPLDHTVSVQGRYGATKRVSSTVLALIFVAVIIASLGIVLLVVQRRRKSMILNCTKEGSMQFSTLNSSHSDDTEPLDGGISYGGQYERKENFLTRIFDNPALEADLMDSQQLIDN